MSGRVVAVDDVDQDERAREDRRRRIKVWQYRGRAIVWAVAGVASFVFGWADSVALVWLASLYANVSTDLGAAEAADNRDVIERLEQLEQLVRDTACRCAGE